MLITISLSPKLLFLLPQPNQIEEGLVQQRSVASVTISLQW